jgi:ribosomal protein L21E
MGVKKKNTIQRKRQAITIDPPLNDGLCNPFYPESIGHIIGKHGLCVEGGWRPSIG